MSHDEDHYPSHFNYGSAALARGDWQEAPDQFRTALIEKKTAEALEGLGMASWWINDVSTNFRRKAYIEYPPKNRRPRNCCTGVRHRIRHPA